MNSENTPQRFFLSCVGQAILNTSSPRYGKYQNARIEIFDMGGRQDGYASAEFEFTAPNEMYFDLYDLFNDLGTNKPFRIKYLHGKFEILEVSDSSREIERNGKPIREEFTSEQLKKRLEKIVKGYEGFEYFEIDFDMQEMFNEELRDKRYE